MSTSTFIDQYYRLRGHDATAINGAETKVDWTADTDPEPKSFTYLSLWGGPFRIAPRSCQSATHRGGCDQGSQGSARAPARSRRVRTAGR